MKIKEKNGPIKEFLVDKLKIKVFSDRVLLGEAVALDSSIVIKELQNQKKALSLMFAAAPSQNEFLSAFVKMTKSSGIKLTVSIWMNLLGLI